VEDLSFINMDELILQEYQSLEYVESTVDTLQKFHDEKTGLFRIAYLDDDHIMDTELLTPNAGTSVICRVVNNWCDEAKYYVDHEKWDKLKEKKEKAIVKISEYPLNKILPLVSMGVLPSYSMSYLAEVLFNESSATSKQAYAVAIRKIIFDILDDQENGKNSLHPFLLYRFTRALKSLKKIIKPSNALDEELKKYMMDYDGAKKSVLDIIGSGPGKEAQFFNAYGRNEDKDKKPLDEFFANPVEFIKKLNKTLESRSYAEALEQITRESGVSGPEMDPAALVFALGVLYETLDEETLGSDGESGKKGASGKYDSVISQGLKSVFQSCDHGFFHTSMPFHSDEKGRAIFVPSIEIANIALKLYLKQARSKRMLAPNLGAALHATGLVQQRLCEHPNIISITKDGTRIPIKGWCTDKAPSYRRVDSWTMAHSLAFFMRRVELIRFAKKKKILVDYSWTPWDKCKPLWEELVDPDMGLEPDGEKGLTDSIKDIIAVKPHNREKSPIFLLYGPPGAAKTSLVCGIANEMKWDLVTLSPSDFISDGLDKVEATSRKIFKDIENLDNCVVLMDEMDSLLRDRNVLKEKAPGSLLEFVVPAFLPKLQRIRDNVKKKNMSVFFVTNYKETIDSAISRQGRIDYHMLVLPYSRKAIYSVLNKMKRILGDSWLLKLAEEDRIPYYDMILDKCPPLLVYREIEDMAVLLKKLPKEDLNDTNIEKMVKKCSLGAINFDLYRGRGDGAAVEYLEMINRILRKNKDEIDKKKYSSIKGAKDFFKEVLTGDSLKIIKEQGWGEIDKLKLHDVSPKIYIVSKKEQDQSKAPNVAKKKRIPKSGG